MDTLITRHFEAPRLLAVKGCAPRWQFCHVDDLTSAIEFAAGGGLDAATFAVGCDGWLEQDAVEQISGLKSIELPARLTFGTAQRLHRLGVTPAPADGSALRDLPVGRRLRRAAGGGLAAALRQRQALRVLLEGRRAATPWPAAASPARKPTITAPPPARRSR